MSVTVEVEGHSVIVDVPDNSVQVAVTGPPGPPGTGGSGLDQATADARYVNLDGDTMSGQLTAPSLEVGYLSSPVAQVGVTTTLDFGDAMPGSGVVIEAASWRISGVGAPTADSDATTKQYVDNRTPPMIVLGPADPVPGGTPAGTVIVRTV